MPSSAHRSRCPPSPGLDRPTDDLAVEQIEYDRRVEPAFVRPDVGEVGRPCLIGWRRGEIPIQQVRRHRQCVGSGAVNEEPLAARRTARLEEFSVKFFSPWRKCKRCGTMKRGTYDEYRESIAWETMRERAYIRSEHGQIVRQPSSDFDQLAHTLRAIGRAQETLRADPTLAGLNVTARHTPRFGGVLVCRCAASLAATQIVPLRFPSDVRSAPSEASSQPHVLRAFNKH